MEIRSITAHHIPHPLVDTEPQLLLQLHQDHVQQRPRMHRAVPSRPVLARQRKPAKIRLGNLPLGDLGPAQVVRRESKCTSYDVTDAAVMTEDGTGYRPADGTWRFRSRVPVYPLTSSSFLVAIDIGKLPKNVTSAQVRAVLERTTVPRSGQDPEQNCVSWTRDAILDLQRVGFAAGALSVEDIMTVGMQRADIVMRDGAPEKPEDRFIDVGVVSREIAAMKAAQKEK